MSDLIKQNSDLLIEELRQLINETRGRVASTGNAELTMLYGTSVGGFARKLCKMNELNTASKLSHQRHDN